MVLGLAAFAAACGGDDDDGGESGGTPATSEDDVNLTQGQDATIAVITHGEGDSFWAVAKKGAEDAGKQTGRHGEVLRVGQRPAEAGAADRLRGDREGRRHRDVSAPNPDAIRDSLKKATDAGIPIITLNSGAEDYQELGAITHVGQTETIAGEGAGAKFKEAGVEEAALRHPRAVEHRPQPALRRRQEGLRRRRREPPGQGRQRHPDDAHRDPVQAAVRRLDRRGADAQPGHRGRRARRDPGRGLEREARHVRPHRATS